MRIAPPLTFTRKKRDQKRSELELIGLRMYRRFGADDQPVPFTLRGPVDTPARAEMTTTGGPVYATLRDYIQIPDWTPQVRVAGA
jgi:hypothetical protein